MRQAVDSTSTLRLCYPLPALFYYPIGIVQRQVVAGPGMDAQRQAPFAADDCRATGIDHAVLPAVQQQHGPLRCGYLRAVSCRRDDLPQGIARADRTGIVNVLPLPRDSLLAFPAIAHQAQNGQLL